MSRTPLAIVVLVAIGCDAPPAVKEPPTAVAPPLPAPSAVASAVASAPSTSTPSASVSAPAPPPPRFTQRELATTEGDLPPLLKSEAERAKQRGLTTIAYFYADWCPPCKTFQKNMAAQEIVDALDGVHLVKLNLDDWHDKLPGTGFTPRKIPAFYLVTEAGKPGKMIDGDRWAKATPATIGAALRGLVQSSSARRP
jgi:thiol-disulfide isomerase/thioredoxin